MSRAAQATHNGTNQQEPNGHSCGEDDEDEECEEHEYSDSESDSKYASDSGSDKSKRQRTYSTMYIKDLEKQVCVLRSENKLLRGKVLKELAGIKRGHESVTRLFTAASGTSYHVEPERVAPTSFNSTFPDVKLVQIYGLGDSVLQEKDSLRTITSPTRFRASGSFPHAVVRHKKTNVVQYEVEGRRQVILKFRLVYNGDKGLANESLVCSDGALPFKMAILYADNNEVVERTDFERLHIPSLTDPVFDAISARPMLNGEVVFKWDMFRARSSDTIPRAREFLVRVTPVLPGLEDHPALTVNTPPFVVLSKVTPKA